MLTIKNDQADVFVRSPPLDIRAFLLLGEDEGLVSERSQQLTKTLAERAGADAAVTRIDGDRIAADPDAYVSDLYGVSLFGGTRILVIRQGGRDITGALAPLLGSPSDDVFLIIEAANLRKDRDAALRAAFGAAKQTAIIVGAPEDRASHSRLIEDEARARNVEVSEEARAALLDLLGPDRLINRHELEKLFLYTMGAARVGDEDVKAIVAGQDPSELDQALDRLLSGEAKSLGDVAANPNDLADKHYQLVRRLMIVMSVAEEMARSQSFPQALRKSGARVPYDMQAALQKHAARFNGGGLRRLTPALFRFLVRSRQHTRLSGILLERFLWNISTSARG